VHFHVGDHTVYARRVSEIVVTLAIPNPISMTVS